MDRVEFYLDDRDDRVNFEAIIWKRSQMTETIEGYLRNHHFYSINRESTRPRWRWSRSRVWALFKTRENPWHRVRRDTMSTMFSWNSSSFSTPHNREKTQIVRHELCSPNKNHYVWLGLRNRRKNSIVSPKDIADDPASLAFKGSSRNVLKRLVRSRRSYGNQAKIMHFSF